MKECSTIIGESKAIRQICKTIGRFAKIDYTALIQGDTGVGKELVAAAIHAHSKVCQGPFIRVNCAALPDNLIESELFGHTKGAFTGAHIHRKGRFEEAQDGTILLDEIGTMSPIGQAKLLRVLQEREFQTVGGSTKRTNARVIATTNVPLEKAAAEGSFRADLYHRLNMVPIYIPPLRDHREDIPLLVYHFLQECCAETSKDIYGFSRQVFQHIMDYDWPGNVRELKNFVRYCIVNEDSQLVQPEICAYGIVKGAVEPAEDRSALFDGVSLKTSLTAIEGRIIRNILSQVTGKKSQAARILKIDKRNLCYFLKKHNLGSFQKKNLTTPFTEKRRSERLGLSLPVSLHFNKGSLLIGKQIIFTQDVSSSGLKFHLPSPPPTHMVRLSFMGPGLSEKVEGSISWFREKAFSGYMVGAEFARRNWLAEFLSGC